MMVLDLRSFDIVEGMGFNEFFILVTNPFSNSNSFENPDKFETLEIFIYRYFGFSHTSLLSTRVKNDSGTIGEG